MNSSFRIKNLYEIGPEDSLNNSMQINNKAYTSRVYYEVSNPEKQN